MGDSDSPHPFVVGSANVKASSISLYLGSGACVCVVCVSRPGCMNKTERSHHDYVHIPLYMPTGESVHEDVCAVNSTANVQRLFRVWKAHLCAGQDAMSHTRRPPVSPSPLHSASDP